MNKCEGANENKSDGKRQNVLFTKKLKKKKRKKKNTKPNKRGKQARTANERKS